jgi:hypothetical protein
MTGVRDLLAEHGKLSYADLAHMIYGPGFSDADRASMARAIRQLVSKGEVISYYEPGSRLVEGQWVETGMWVRRPDVAHIETPRFHDLPSSETGDPRWTEGMSHAQLLRQDPTYGDRRDCQECGRDYASCFALADNHHTGDGSHVSYWGDGTPVYSDWSGSPVQCCVGCFHRELASPLRATNGHGHMAS